MCRARLERRLCREPRGVTTCASLFLFDASDRGRNAAGTRRAARCARCFCFVDVNVPSSASGFRGTCPVEWWAKCTCSRVSGGNPLLHPVEDAASWCTGAGMRGVWVCFLRTRVDSSVSDAFACLSPGVFGCPRSSTCCRAICSFRFLRHVFGNRVSVSSIRHVSSPQQCVVGVIEWVLYILIPLFGFLARWVFPKEGLFFFYPIDVFLLVVLIPVSDLKNFCIV